MNNTTISIISLAVLNVTSCLVGQSTGSIFKSSTTLNNQSNYVAAVATGKNATAAVGSIVATHSEFGGKVDVKNRSNYVAAVATGEGATAAVGSLVAK